jgi:methylenetetrahydrofolate dehydrogenase (NADP+)/methenyltetrahydrofolate cyclohydrolase
MHVSATIIDGRAAAATLRDQIAVRTTWLKGHEVIPGLAVVLVGADPASQVYVASKTRQAAEVGIRHFDHRLATASTAELVALVQDLNARSDVHGILVQLPLPPDVDTSAVLGAIDPTKDVDGFHAINAGRLAIGEEGMVPCTPLGCLILLRQVVPSLSGKRALVIGRSNIVGRPMAQLLLRQDCTVTIAHSRTRDLAAECADAEIVVAAIGRPKAIRGEWIRPGAIVIDVGINRIADDSGKSRLVGDVDYATAVERASAITPVPGGVGPMTIACLLLNTLNATLRARFGPSAELLKV